MAKHLALSGRKDARANLKKLQLNWGDASASQSKRDSVDAKNVGNAVNRMVCGVVDQCDVCTACGKAPHLPIASTSSASQPNEIVRAGLIFLGDILTAYSLMSFPERSLPSKQTGPSRPLRSLFLDERIVSSLSSKQTGQTVCPAVPR